MFTLLTGKGFTRLDILSCNFGNRNISCWNMFMRWIK